MSLLITAVVYATSEIYYMIDILIWFKTEVTVRDFLQDTNKKETTEITLQFLKNLQMEWLFNWLINVGLPIFVTHTSFLDGKWRY